MGARLVLPVKELNQFDLPPVCILTGAREDVSFHPVNFQWYPRWIALLIFIPYGLFVALILALALRKRARGELPFSAKARARFVVAKVAWGLSLVWFVLSIFGAMFVLFSDQLASWAGPAALAACLGVPIAVWFATARWRLDILRITDAQLTLKIPRAEVAAAFDAHLHAGVVQAVPVAAAPSMASARR